MISQDLIEKFQEEIKMSIADVAGQDYPSAFAVSLHDGDGIVWVEGLLRARSSPRCGGTEYLLQYSLQRDFDLPQDCPYAISITIIDECE
ncbi:MAG: hypothetical protein PVF83_01440 [Anaerolineales bacterium]|jgi:hypothetical protein